ncbi:Calx-beta domain-containing protein [Aliamphritea spongicola]|nr:Calx-beta domain-containing protein [Aliamphritea spongicola]
MVEGETTTDYTVSLSDAVPAGKSVTVALTYSYTTASGTDITEVADVTITGPASSATFNIATIDDALAEGAEDFTVSLGTITDTNDAFEAIVAGTNNSVETTITDQTGSDNPPGTEDTVIVSLTGPSDVVEGETTTDYTVSLSEAVPAGKSVTVALTYSYTTASGTDITEVADVTITGPASSATFNIATIDDALAEGAEDFTVSLGTITDTNDAFEAIVAGTNNSVETTITDQTGSDNPPGTEDTVIVSLTGPSDVVEGETTTDYTVSLSEAVPAGKSVTVALTYSYTTASGTDITEVADVTITGPASSATFNIATIDDALAEGAEDFTVSLGTITDTNDAFEAIVAGTNNSVETTITDQTGSDNPPGTEDTVIVSLTGPSDVVEGETTTDYTVSLSEAVPAGKSVTVALTYSYTTASGTDITEVADVTITGPASSATFNIATIDDALAEGAEDFTVSLGTITDTNDAFEAIVAGTNNSVETTITDQTGSDNPPGTEDTVIVSLTGPSDVVEGETTTDYTVSLSDAVPAGKSVTVALTYSYTTASGADITEVADVTITGPASSATFNIATIDDALAEGAEDFTVSLGTITDTNDAFEAIVAGTNNSVETTITDQTGSDNPPGTEDTVIVS